MLASYEEKIGAVQGEGRDPVSDVAVLGLRRHQVSSVELNTIGDVTELEDLQCCILSRHWYRLLWFGDITVHVSRPLRPS